MGFKLLASPLERPHLVVVNKLRSADWITDCNEKVVGGCIVVVKGFQVDISVGAGPTRAVDMIGFEGKFGKVRSKGTVSHADRRKSLFALGRPQDEFTSRRVFVRRFVHDGRTR